MKQEDRERIGRALLRGVEDLPAEIRKDLEECCARDVDAIEPIVDQIVRREVADKLLWLFEVGPYRKAS